MSYIRGLAVIGDTEWELDLSESHKTTTFDKNLTKKSKT